MNRHARNSSTIYRQLGGYEPYMAEQHQLNNWQVIFDLQIDTIHQFIDIKNTLKALICTYPRLNTELITRNSNLYFKKELY